MHYKFSKFAKRIIVINLILTLIVLAVHVYNFNRIRQTNSKIHQVMTERQVRREKAIQLLEERGEVLFLGDEMFTLFGMISSLAVFLFSYFFARNFNHLAGFAAAVSSLLTSFIGGLLLFYLLFSGKISITKEQRDALAKEPKNDFESWLSNRNGKGQT